jgi:hypothetical protein
MACAFCWDYLQGFWAGGFPAALLAAADAAATLGKHGVPNILISALVCAGWATACATTVFLASLAEPAEAETAGTNRMGRVVGYFAATALAWVVLLLASFGLLMGEPFSVDGLLFVAWAVALTGVPSFVLTELMWRTTRVMADEVGKRWGKVPTSE